MLTRILLPTLLTGMAPFFTRRYRVRLEIPR